MRDQRDGRLFQITKFQGYFTFLENWVRIFLMSVFVKLSCLGVKRVEMKQINTFEFLGVNLLKSYLVIGSLEYVDFLHHIQGALSVITLLGDGDLRVVVALGGLTVLRVGEYNERDPEIVNLGSGEEIIGALRLQVMIFQSVEETINILVFN